MTTQKISQEALRKLRASSHLIEQDSAAFAPLESQQDTNVIADAICGPSDELAYQRMLREMAQEAAEDEQEK